MFWQTLNLMKKEQSFLDVLPDMNQSVKATQNRRDNAGYHLTEIIVLAAHIRNSAAQRFTKRLQPLSPRKMHRTEQKARDICKAKNSAI